jgi:hypothetical protein
MPNKHKNKLVGWNPEDPTLKQWVTDRAAKAEVTVREYLDRVLAEHRKTVEQQETTTEGQS